MTSLQVHLDEYCKAFNNRALDAALHLFSAHALFEMPLLGQRLVGAPEIQAGLRCIFSVTESAAIELPSIEESPRAIIGEGRLRAKLHRDRSEVEMPLAVVLEARDGSITRLSQYLDARLYRLWSDGPIFAQSASEK
ncbi:MAG: nuclear transport factor 2 family protein [Parvibaculaceae bacterium]